MKNHISRKTAVIVFVGFICLAVAYRPLRDQLRGYFEITSYPVMKDDNGDWNVPLNRSVHRIYPKEHRAIYWSPWVRESPKELVDCIIRDPCNWQCSFPDHNGVVTMEGCREPDDEEYGFKFVSALSWWKYHYGWR